MKKEVVDFQLLGFLKEAEKCSNKVNSKETKEAIRNGTKCINDAYAIPVKSQRKSRKLTEKSKAIIEEMIERGELEEIEETINVTEIRPTLKTIKLFKKGVTEWTHSNDNELKVLANKLSKLIG